MIKNIYELGSQINNKLANMNVNPDMLKNPAWDEQSKLIINDLKKVTSFSITNSSIELKQNDNSLYIQETSIFGVKSIYIINVENPNKIEILYKKDYNHSVRFGMNCNHNEVSKRTIEYISAKKAIKTNTINSFLIDTEEKKQCVDHVDVEQCRYSSEGILIFKKNDILPTYVINKNYTDVSLSEQLLNHLNLRGQLDNLSIKSTTLVRDQIDVAILTYIDKKNGKKFHGRVILNNFNDLVNMNYDVDDNLYDIMTIYPEEAKFYYPYIQKVPNFHTRRVLTNLALERINYQYRSYHDKTFVCEGFKAEKESAKKRSK